MGTSTEAYDYLRLLLARIGRVYCRQCGREVVRHSPQSVAAEIAHWPAGTKFMVAFPWPAPASVNPAELAARIVEEGFVRAVVDDRLVDLAEFGASAGAVHVAEIAADDAADEAPLDDRPRRKRRGTPLTLAVAPRSEREGAMEDAGRKSCRTSRR